MFTIGSAAPTLTFADTDGQPQQLTDPAGEHSTLVYFMRSLSCPVCNRHVRDLAAHREELFASGVRVLIAVPESRAAAHKWKAKHRISFPVLTGPADSPHESIGLTRKMFGSMQQSGALLVDAAGIVRYAHGATLPTASYNRKAIMAAVASVHSR